MIRALTIVAAALFVAGSARAQSLGGSVQSGFASNISSGFSGTIGSGFQSGFGPNIRGRARIDDVTLGSTGGLTPGMLKGHPSNFGPSVQSMTQIRGTTLTFDRGPETSVDLGAGPAGPMD